SECRSTLFWKGDGRDYTAIAASAIDGPTGLKLAGHIFCDDAGDYYEISGELIMPRGASNRTLDKLAGHGVRWTVLPYDKMQLNGGGIHCSTTALIHDAA
ncbi:MAG TPA: hypothetical protein VL101_12685, partial [Nordella sp.]|nr:hypothetical protein [Nordella sp.]